MTTKINTTNKSMRPLLVVPAIPKDNGIKFVMPKHDITLEPDIAPTAWKILELCNGVATIKEILKQIKDVDASFIKGFINDLQALDVIIDSRQLYLWFHSISNNPDIYPSDMKAEEIIKHTNSARMPTKKGKIFKFEKNFKSELLKLQNLRSSCRSFSDEGLSINEVGQILDVGYSFDRHAVPSAGNLYPMKIFVIATKDQKDFPAGYYEYDNENNNLILFNESPDEHKIHYALNDVEMPFGAPIVFIIAADAHRQPCKYSNRGYRFMNIEAGEIAQNISLAAVEIGLSTCELGGMLDNVISVELKFKNCIPLLAIALGKETSKIRDNYWLLANEYENAFIKEDKSVSDIWLIDNTFLNNYDKVHFQFLAKAKNGQVTSGISTSWPDAKLKAIVEAHERQCSANVRWDIVEKAADIDCDWLDPRAIAPLGDKQYKILKHLQKFHEDLEIEWIKGVRQNGDSVYVPIDLIFYPIKNINRKLIVDTCSSGFATYTSYDDAVNRGLLELIERDSLMRYWYEKTSPKRFSQSIFPRHLKNRVAFWKNKDRKVILLDLSQNGVIVVETIIISKDYPCFVSGAASSLENFDETAIKSFQEAESRLIHGLNNEPLKTIRPEEVISVLDHELLYAQSEEFHKYIKFLWEGKITNIIPKAQTNYLQLRETMDIVVIDVSAKNSPLSTVKVISPKLVPISFGYGAGHHLHKTLNIEDCESLNITHYFA